MSILDINSRRGAVFRSLEEAPLDLLVIGGGIVGSGIARDAAMRGLRIGLVEQHDFAFGTSSRSSRLLHGGMRYLAQGRIGLVREASLEKKVVHRIAPHLADPLPFIFPVYSDNRHWQLWQLKIGVKIYDLLCGGRNLGNSSWLNTSATLAKVPVLRRDSLKGSVRYFDGFTNDARLVLDTLRSAAKHGAFILNYCRFENASRQDLWNCQLLDVISGRKYAVKARAVVNATGPWADGLPHSSVKLRLTKGVHIVVDRARVPVPDTVVMTEGKRILFAIPWGERTIIGTTDTDYNGPLDDIRAEPNDLDYILKITNQFFPEAKLLPADIVSAWAGLRPLIADRHGNPSDISRSHEIKNPELFWWDVAGGKLTTYRLMAEQTVDRVMAAVRPRPRGVKYMTLANPCRTAIEPLLPENETKNISGILPQEPTRKLVEHFCANEWTLHLDDLMIRRSGWHYYRRDARDLARQVANWMAESLGWSNEQCAQELDRYLKVSK